MAGPTMTPAHAAAPLAAPARPLAPERGAHRPGAPAGGTADAILFAARPFQPRTHRARLQAPAAAWGHLTAAAAAAASLTPVPVRLVVPGLQLQFGEQLKAVGEHPSIGNWYSKAAPFLAWEDGHNWVHHCQLPPGMHEFKIVIVRDNGTMYWEEGDNRVFEIPEERFEGVLEVICEFGNTAKTAASVVEAEVLEDLITQVGELSEAAAEAAAEAAPQQQQQQEQEEPFAATLDADEPEPEAVPEPEAAAELEMAAEAAADQQPELEAEAELQPELEHPQPAVAQQQAQQAVAGNGASSNGASHPRAPQQTAALGDAVMAWELAPEPEQPSQQQQQPQQQQQQQQEEQQQAVFAAQQQPEPDFEPEPEQEAPQQQQQRRRQRPTFDVNGSNIVHFGRARAAVLGQDSLFVTFSDDDDEDAAGLAERLLASKLPRAGRK